MVLCHGASRGQIQMRSTGKHKSHIEEFNNFLVDPGEYASKKQILEAGGRIKKEEMKNSHIIVYWLWKEKKKTKKQRRKRPLQNLFIIEFGRLINSVPD